MREITEVLDGAARLVEPSPREIRIFEDIANNILKMVKTTASNTCVRSKVVLGGSYAKSTWLKGECDIDIFIKFPASISMEELETMGVTVGKDALRDYQPRLRYSEHPYVEAFVDGVRVNVVACYQVKKGEWKSSADRSPYHTELIVNKFDENMKREARVLKLFMKSIGTYGAEVKVQGFSGYVCEVLILKYRKFISLLETASSFKDRDVVSLDAVDKDLSKKHKSSLIILDPVDNRRNLGAAISSQNVGKFILAARTFLNNPQISIFKKQSVEVVEKSNLTPNLVCVLFKHKTKAIDILWGQLGRSVKHLQRQIEKAGFRVIRAKAASDEETQSAFIFLMEDKQLPDKVVRAGPKVFRKEALDGFLSKNLKDAELSWIGNDARAFILNRRDLRRIDQLLKEILSSKLTESGVAPGLVSDVSKSFKVLSGSETVNLARQMKWLMEVIHQLVNTDDVITNSHR